MADVCLTSIGSFVHAIAVIYMGREWGTTLVFMVDAPIVLDPTADGRGVIACRPESDERQQWSLFILPCSHHLFFIMSSHWARVSGLIGVADEADTFVTLWQQAFALEDSQVVRINAQAMCTLKAESQRSGATVAAAGAADKQDKQDKAAPAVSAVETTGRTKTLMNGDTVSTLCVDDDGAQALTTHVKAVLGGDGLPPWCGVLFFPQSARSSRLGDIGLRLPCTWMPCEYIQQQSHDVSTAHKAGDDKGHEGRMRHVARGALAAAGAAQHDGTGGPQGRSRKTNSGTSRTMRLSERSCMLVLPHTIFYSAAPAQQHGHGVHHHQSHHASHAVPLCHETGNTAWASHDAAQSQHGETGMPTTPMTPMTLMRPHRPRLSVVRSAFWSMSSARRRMQGAMRRAAQTLPGWTTLRRLLRPMGRGGHDDDDGDGDGGYPSHGAVCVPATVTTPHVLPALSNHAHGKDDKADATTRRAPPLWGGASATTTTAAAAGHMPWMAPLPISSGPSPSLATVGYNVAVPSDRHTPIGIHFPLRCRIWWNSHRRVIRDWLVATCLGPAQPEFVTVLPGANGSILCGNDVCVASLVWTSEALSW